MKNKKSLKNLGFTLYEVLVVIAIIGIITSISLPIVMVTYNRHRQLVFEQKCKMYEKVFLDTYDKYQFEFYGTTPLTKDIKLRVPFIKKIETEEELFVDILDTTFVYYFLHETLVNSEFAYDDCQIDYSPATISSKYKFYPSTLTLSLGDNTKIEYHLEIMTTKVNFNQSAFIRKVKIIQNDLVYEFEV